MLAGTRNARGPVSEERFRAQWADPTVATELAALGFERPEDLGALFIADATYLRAISAATPPVVDDFPKRIVAPSLFAPVELDGPGLYGSWSDTNAARSRFVASALVAHLWPEPLRASRGRAPRAGNHGAQALPIHYCDARPDRIWLYRVEIGTAAQNGE